MILSLGPCILALFLLLPQPLKTQIKSKIIKKGRFQYSFKTIVDETKLMTGKEGVSGSVRVNLWRESLRMIEDHPIIGVGLNTYARVAPKYKSFESGGGYPHNSYLQKTAETGLLDYLLLSAFCSYFSKRRLSICVKKRISWLPVSSRALSLF